MSTAVETKSPAATLAGKYLIVDAVEEVANLASADITSGRFSRENALCRGAVSCLAVLAIVARRAKSEAWR
jgi:hypothetical protein